MSREATFTFIPESSLTFKKVGSPTNSSNATVSLKYGTLQFSKGYVRSNNLKNKFITLYGDASKKAIAWKIFDDGDLSTLSYARQVKVNKNECHQPISVKKILNTFSLKEKDKSFKRLTVKKYKEGGYLHKGEYHYIELKKQEEKNDAK